MLSPDQIKMIQTTRRRAGLDEAAWRLMLHNIGDVHSCKDLDNTTFEDCMAFLEDQTESRQTYWRDKVRLRGTFANARLVHKINELFAEYEAAATALGISQDKQLKRPGLVDNASHGRTNSPSGLTPHEAWRLIESLKAIIARCVPVASGQLPVVSSEASHA